MPTDTVNILSAVCFMSNKEKRSTRLGLSSNVYKIWNVGMCIGLLEYVSRQV